MKRGTIEHPKMMMLASILSCPKYAAVGIMECLWHFTSRYAPQGDVGKYSDKVIAESVGWQDDPKILISALIECNFLQIEKTHRLVVHDWSHHADDAVNKFLNRRKLKFADGLKPFAKVETKARPRHARGTPEARPIYDQPLPLPLPTPEPTPTPLKTVARAPQLTDQEFVESLKSNPAYQHIDIDHEIGKMDAWLSLRKGRTRTRRFLVNWLNKIERPMGGNCGKTGKRQSVVEEWASERGISFEPNAREGPTDNRRALPSPESDEGTSFDLG